MSEEVTTAEAATLLSCTDAHVRRLVAKHKWQHRKLNPRLMLIDRSVVEQYKRDRDAGLIKRGPKRKGDQGEL